MNGSEDADFQRFVALFDDFAAVIKALLVRIVGDEEEAEDLLTDTFVSAWKRFSLLDDDPLPALIEIARARGLEWVRANGAPVSFDECTVLKILVVGGSPLEKLPLMQRRAVEHLFFEGGSVSRFAREVNVPRDWVFAALEHAMTALWEDLQNEEIEASGLR